MGSLIPRYVVAKVFKKLLVGRTPGGGRDPPEVPEGPGCWLDVRLSWLTRLHRNVERTSVAVPLDRQTEVMVPFFEKSVYRRVCQIVKPWIQEDQCGFHPGRGTVDLL